MTICMYKDWHIAAQGAGSDLMPWLRDTGSLTQRIQQRCANFSVLNVKSSLARIALDESILLGIKPGRLAWSRDVFLCADEQPVVFAHSACADLRGVWQALRGLGNKPLGALLFSHPQVLRQPLHYKALRGNHPLYRRAASVLTAPPDRLWARRSLFYLHHAPLLVTEVFLPEISKLGLRSEERGCVQKTLCEPNLTQSSIHDPRSSILTYL